jgi:hypothetical protein
MNGLDRYLESGYSDQADRDDWLQDRVNELMMGEYDPYKPKNIVEAIYEDCLYTKEGDLEQFADLMAKREVTALGRMVFGRIIDYWERRAEEHAIEDLNGGNRD